MNVNLLIFYFVSDFFQLTLYTTLPSIFLQRKEPHSFLWMNNASWEYMSYFKIHSSVNAHLKWFYLLTVLHSAAINMDACLFGITISFLLETQPVQGLLDYIAVLFLVFSGASVLFSIETIIIYIPTDSVRALLFFCI